MLTTDTSANPSIASQVCTTTATVTTVPIPCGSPRWIRYGMGVASTYNPANNDKYVSVDGHIEGVYDENGNLVTDSVNQGTYNFANPNKDPIGHFIKDVIPYYIWGNSPDDPTSFWERVTGTYSGNVDGE